MDGIEAFIFDFGGTLDSRGEHWYHVMNRAYREEGLELTRDAYIRAERNITPLVRPTDTMLDLLRKKVALQGGPEIVAERCYAHARRCVEEAAVELRRLDALGYPMAVVSNFYGNLEAVLRDYGILRLFKTVVDSAVAGVRKPDPAIFRLAIERLCVAPHRILVVGDSMRNDILPARTLGCPTFLVDGKGWDEE